MSRCTDCEFHKGCVSSLVEPLGPNRSDYLVVIDYPSKPDDDKDELGNGDAGSKLRYLFELAGIDWENVHFTSAIRCYPGYKPKIKKVHLDACTKHLLNSYKRVQPKVVIMMGAVGTEMLLGEKTIGDMRGDFHTMEFIDDTGGKERTRQMQIICTYGPGAALQKWEWDSVIVHDLKRAKNFVENGEIPKCPKIDVDFVTSSKQLNTAVDYLLSNPKFAFDFETTGLIFHKHKIIQAGFCAESGKSIVIPFYCYNDDETKKFDDENLEIVKRVNTFVSSKRDSIHSAFVKLFSSKEQKKIAHNGKFDAHFASHNGFPVRNFWFDTVVAHALIDENKAHDLTFCLDWYTPGYGNYEKELWQYVNKTRKSRKPYSYVPPKILAENYLAKDVNGTFVLHEKFLKLLAKQEMTDLFFKQQMPLLRLMQRIEFQGIKVDVERLQSISMDLAKVLQEIDCKIKKITKDPNFNPNSTKQLSDYLFEIGALGNEGDKKTRGGALSTDESVLTYLSTTAKEKYARVPRLILESRSIGKLKSNYLDGKNGETGLLEYIDSKGFVHYSSNIHTPRTGRMSVDSPALQTIPRLNPKYPAANIRQLFIPSNPKWVIGSVDFKQLEMRIAAYLSQDRVMIKEIQDGVDMHSRNAVTLGSRVGMLSTDVTEKEFLEIIKYSGDDKAMKQLCLEWQELRNLVKALGFGLNYGMEAQTLAKDHGRDVDDMQDMITAYFDKYEGLYLWRQMICEKAIDKGIIRLPETGRKRRFTGASKWFADPYSESIHKRAIDIDAIHRQAMNYPIQGYANEIFVSGKLRFDRAIRKASLRSSILLSLHDGMLLQGPISEMAELKVMAKRTLERTLGQGKRVVPLTIDFDVYDRWTGNKVAIGA